MGKNYRVVKILNDTALVINGGLNEGIKRGDEFEIIYIGEPIIDFETKEELGKVEVVKTKIRVSIVYDKMCLCETQYTQNFNYSMTSLFSSKRETLNVDPDDFTSSFDLSIKIGDPAILVKKAIKNDDEKQDSI